MSWSVRAVVFVAVLGLAGCGTSQALQSGASTSTGTSASAGTGSYEAAPATTGRRPGQSASGVLSASQSAVAVPSIPRSTVAAASADPRYDVAVLATTPLARGRSVLCGDVAVPAAVFAMPGRAELGSSSSSLALKGFLAHDPWGDTSPVTGREWMLLAANDKEYVFGQRTGKVGMGAVVIFVNRGGRYVVSQLGGCGTVVPGPGEDSAIVNSVTRSGRRVTISWENGRCSANGPLDQVVVRVETVQTNAAVHLLVVTRRSPAAPPVGTMCAGVGGVSTSVTMLDAPLGARQLLNDAKVPAEVITFS